tara:strand:+ start:170 stop:1498 length:1329 start_codon:yes stop_codon:yes gene_type:complete
MEKITLLFCFIFCTSVSTAQTIMTHNSSQEITEQASALCQSYSYSDIEWDYFCEGILDNANHSCPTTVFTAQTSGNYVIRISDVFGDGWFGKSLNVLVNNEVVLEGLGLDFQNRWVKEFVFEVNEGDQISTNWLGSSGSFNQCGYGIATESEINSVEFPSNTFEQIYYRQFIPFDFGFSGTLDLTHIQFGVWYTDENGNEDLSLPNQDIQANIYINNEGGVGGQFGNNLEFEFVASTAPVGITPSDHKGIVTAPIEFDSFGNFLEDGYEADSNLEYVVELIFPSGAPIIVPGSPLESGFRLSTGGNFSDFILDSFNQSPNPSTRTLNDNNCQPFFTYTPDNTILINLVTSSTTELGIGNNPHENKITISKSLTSEYLIINGLNNSEVSSLKLFNLLGQETLIKKLEVNNPTQRILVSSLQSGIYIALLEVNGVSITKKIVIN